MNHTHHHGQSVICTGTVTELIFVKGDKNESKSEPAQISVKILDGFSSTSILCKTLSKTAIFS